MHAAAFVIIAYLVVIASSKHLGRSASLRIRSSRLEAPKGFVSLSAAPADRIIPLRIALVQKNITGLERALYDVSTPGSTSYGRHLSKEQVNI